MWYPGKAAFRAGQVVRQRWNNANIGNHSVAMGFDPVASGDSSFAVGSNAAARGNHSVAIGSGARAEGNYSFALGRDAAALDDGVVFLADSTGTPDGVVLGMPNTFFANFAGGYRLRSGSGGVRLSPGSGSWSMLSDVRQKANFRDLDGESVLRRLAGIPIREWNYISQDASIRHVGPMAQDFRQAFGLGEDETTISSVDPDGISLRAIQALDARTEKLREENDALRKELDELRKTVERLLKNR